MRNMTTMALAGLLVLASGAACAIHEPEEHPSVINALPAYANAPELGGEQFAAQRRALTAQVDAYLREQYRIEQGRFFAIDADKATWVAIEKQMDQELAAQGGFSHQRSFNWHRMGKDLVAVWSLDPEWQSHAAVAMAPEPLPDGRRLVGYFQLEKRPEQ